MQAREFLEAVVTTEEGFFCLALAQANGSGLVETWYLWPRDVDAIVGVIEESQQYNIYFSPYLFMAQSRARENVLPSRTIVIDLDEAPLDSLPVQPTVLVRTSEGRHQGYWLMNEASEPSIHESMSRRLTYAIDKADRASWPIGHTARMPFTVNYKYNLAPEITVVKHDMSHVYAQEIIELLPDDTLPGTEEDIEWANGGMETPAIGPQAFLQQLKQDKRLPPKVILEYNITQPDRSAALWGFMNACFRAGLTRDEVFHLAWSSRNNKWADVKYHGKRELAKDVLRCERVVRRRAPDPREGINQIRVSSGHSFEKHAQISRMVYDHMLLEGDFVHTDDNKIYYVKRDIGRPIELAKVSEHLSAILDLQFGLNASETDTHYVTENLLAKAITLPADTDVGSLSTYNPKSNSILIHTGRRDVIRVSANGLDRFTNGSHGVLFPWSVGTDPFEPDYTPLPDGQTWWQAVFEDSFQYVQDMPPENALALMRVWTIFILMRRMVATRPILAFFGPPGSGKTTIMKRIYRFLYGKHTDLLQLTTAEKFDLSTVNNAFVCVDNADTWTNWLPDRMALAISDVQTEQRKLWTNGDVWLQRRQAVLGVTAHNPKFGREDISSRLLLLTFKIIPDDDKRDEVAIYNRILAKRNKIWGAIIKDIQAVMATAPLADGEAPKFRIADFAMLGARIARSQGIEKEFAAALQAIRAEQKLFTLEEENTIVTAMTALANRDAVKPDPDGTWRTSGALFNTLGLLSGNAQTWERTYHDARSFSKKLQAMQEALGQLFAIESKLDTSQGVKVWRVSLKNEGAVYTNGTVQGTTHLVKG